LLFNVQLLFDLKAETDILAKGQGAVLLTYQSSAAEPHAGSVWLTIAIQNAMIYGAHVYSSAREQGADRQRRNAKKRIWWSILLHDRILPLGVRRHLQITPGNFNLELDRMTEEDLDDEIYHSEVYDAETKRLLARVLQVQCELALVLTDVIMLVYTPNGFGQPRSLTEPQFSKTIKELGDLRGNLMQWSNDAKYALGPGLNSDKAHESVILYSGLTFVYFQYVLI
jgi:hypothetical protein